MVLDHLVIQSMSKSSPKDVTTSSQNPSSIYNKKEFSTILKFGAEEIFKDEEEERERGEGERELGDIDAILSRAIEFDGRKGEQGIGKELMDSFKVFIFFIFFLFFYFFIFLFFLFFYFFIFLFFYFFIFLFFYFFIFLFFYFFIFYFYFICLFICFFVYSFFNQKTNNINNIFVK